MPMFLSAIDDFSDFVKMKYGKSREKRKFRDPRRKKIYETVHLTDEQIRETNELFIKNYGKKVPLTWHRHFTAFTGNFDKNYLPELLFIPELQHFLNFDVDRYKILADKNFLPLVAKAIGVKMPRTIVCRIRGAYRDADGKKLSYEQVLEKLTAAGTFFLKPSVDTSSGRGCRLVSLKDGKDAESGDTLEKIIAAAGEDFVAQERIVCSDEIRALYPYGVNTFRVITYRWKDDIRVLPVIMRIGSGGGHVDNAHAGGMFIATDDDGTLHKTAFTEFNKRFDRHPDTDIVFDGYKIGSLPTVVQTAKRLHEALPQIGIVNWDFTVDASNEAVLVEANIGGGSIWLPQTAHGKGAFGEQTPEILRWIRNMEKLPKHKRVKHTFGK